LCFTRENKAIWKENLAIYQESLTDFFKASLQILLLLILKQFIYNNYFCYKFFFCDRKDHTKCEFSVHDVFAVDLLISTGEGKTKEKDTRTTVYKKTENNYSLKMKASRGTTVNNYCHFYMYGHFHEKKYNMEILN